MPVNVEGNWGVSMMTKKKPSLSCLFRDHCVVDDGTLDRMRLHVSGEALHELSGFVDAYRMCLPNYRFYNGNRERLIVDFARHCCRLCVADGRKTVLRRDVIGANAFIKLEDYLHE